MTDQHTCHLPGCSRPTPRKWLFCAKHWRKVSAATKKRVYAAYYANQRAADGHITEFESARARQEYVDACKQAREEALAA